MTEYEKYPHLEELIAFHGHMCPGLAIGYRATMAGLERLGIERAADEELIAIVENDSCSVDAVQFLAGTTFGKGNLFFRDWGKQVFTLARRDSNEAVRVALKWDALDTAPSEAEDSRQQKIDFILTAPLDDLFEIRESTITTPPRAEIRRSVRCDSCHEPVMDTRTAEKDGKNICQGCAAD
jgi:formylmethanofuran dehydrogenase subunit E